MGDVMMYVLQRRASRIFTDYMHEEGALHPIVEGMVGYYELCIFFESPLIKLFEHLIGFPDVGSGLFRLVETSCQQGYFA